MGIQNIQPDKDDSNENIKTKKKVAIQIDNKFRISSTRYAWIIEEQVKNKWYERRNYSSLQSLLKDFLEYFTREDKGQCTASKIKAVNNALLTAVECQRHLIEDLADEMKRPLVNTKHKSNNNSKG